MPTRAAGVTPAEAPTAAVDPAADPHAHHSGVVATEMRRDADRLFDEDNFQVILDTFKDSRNGYMFLTTPLGAKLEQQIFDEGEGGGRGTTSNVNRNWEGVWDSAAQVTADGWTAEMAIPTNTLRFKPERRANLGHQLPAPYPPQERTRLLGAHSARLQPYAREPGRGTARPART